MVSPASFSCLSVAKQLIDHDRREPERQLVDDENLRIGHQPARDRHHLLLAARQRAGLLALALGEARKQREHLVEPVGIFAAPRAWRTRPFPDFRRRSSRRTIAGLPAPARSRAPPWRGVGSRVTSSPSNSDLAAPRRDRCRRPRASVVVLPAPLAPTMAVSAPRRGLERHAPQHLHLAVAGFEVLDCQQRSACDGGSGGIRIGGVSHCRASVQLLGELRIAEIGLDDLRIAAPPRPAGLRRASGRN